MCSSEFLEVPYNQTLCQTTRSYYEEFYSVMTGQAERRRLRASGQTVEQALDWSEMNALCNTYGESIDQSSVNSGIQELYQSQKEFLNGALLADWADRRMVGSMITQLDWLSTYMQGKPAVEAPDIDSIKKGDPYQYAVAKTWREQFERHLDLPGARLAALKFLKEQGTYLRSEIENGELTAAQENDAIKAFLLANDLVGHIEEAAAGPQIIGGASGRNMAETGGGSTNFGAVVVSGGGHQIARTVELDVKRPEFNVGFGDVANPTLLAWERLFNATFVETLHYNLEACAQNYINGSKKEKIVCRPEDVVAKSLSHTRGELSSPEVDQRNLDVLISWAQAGGTRGDYDNTLLGFAYGYMGLQIIDLPNPAYPFKSSNPGWFNYVQATGQQGRCPNIPINFVSQGGDYVRRHIEACYKLEDISTSSFLVNPSPSRRRWLISDSVITNNGDFLLQTLFFSLGNDFSLER